MLGHQTNLSSHFRFVRLGEDTGGLELSFFSFPFLFVLINTVLMSLLRWPFDFSLSLLAVVKLFQPVEVQSLNPHPWPVPKAHLNSLHKGFRMPRGRISTQLNVRAD
jgi:hypothetical protein